MDPDQIRIERHKLEQDAGQALQKLMDEFEAKTAWKINGISVSITDSGTQLDMRGGGATQRLLAVSVHLEEL